MNKRSISIALCIGILLSLLTIPASAGELSNFQKVQSYTGQFADVPSTAWYGESVQTAYEMGLLNGKSAGRFDPASNLTLAEAAKLAACLNKIYETGKQDFASDPVWYLPYVEYLSEQGLMSISVADWSAKATRAQFAALLAASLPQEALVPINDISDGAIPDVSAGAWYHDAVYTLYRAGVLTGSGSNGSFLPDANIQRSEVAAIIARMADINQRKKVSLTPPMTAETLFAQCSPSVVYIEVADASGRVFATGSGFFISADGKLVTNHHVIQGASSATVKTTDGKVHKVLGVYDTNAALDLAVLQVEGSGYPYLTQGDSQNLSTGASVYAIGSPLGLENSLSAGIISSPSRTIQGGTYIQITAPISPGSSGGALIDAHGQVIGVTQGSLVDGQSLNLAVPVHLLSQLNLSGSYQALSDVKAKTSAVTVSTVPGSVSVAVGQTVTVQYNLTDPDQAAEYTEYKISDSSICTCEYGDWIGDNFPLYITGRKAGTATITMYIDDGAGNRLATHQLSVTVTGTAPAAPASSYSYYAGYYPAIDYGQFVGAPVYLQNEYAGDMSYFYRFSDFQVDTNTAVSGYFNQLLKEGFYFEDGYDTYDGSTVVIHVHPTYRVRVSVRVTQLGGISGMVVQLSRY